MTPREWQTNSRTLRESDSNSDGDWVRRNCNGTNPVPAPGTGPEGALMKLSKDNPATLEFALQSGKLIQNFGVVELISYDWIGALSRSAIAVEIAREVPLAKRIDIIVRLLGRNECALPAQKRGQGISFGSNSGTRVAS